jgi:hypothetical protein
LVRSPEEDLRGQVSTQFAAEGTNNGDGLKGGSIAVFVGEEGGGRCRSVEKSKSRTFPPRLEIPQVQQDFHFSHRPCRDEEYFDFPV